jgi:hypothetical protein
MKPVTLAPIFQNSGISTISVGNLADIDNSSVFAPVSISSVDDLRPVQEPLRFDSSSMFTSLSSSCSTLVEEQNPDGTSTLPSRTSRGDELYIHIKNFPSISYPDSPLPRALNKKSFRFWQRLCVSCTVIEYFRFKQLRSSSHRTSLCKSEYLETAFRYYAKKLIRRYASEIPSGLTIEKLCRVSLHASTVDLSNESLSFITGQVIYRNWTDITTRVNQSYNQAWNEILTMFPLENIRDSSHFNDIYSRFRKKLWEIQSMVDCEADEDVEEVSYKRGYKKVCLF